MCVIAFFFTFVFMKIKKKKILLGLHKYLGLSTGLVLFIVALTGCFLSFKEEIENCYSPFKTVTVEVSDFLKPSTIKNIASKSIPNKTIHGVVYGNPDEALEVVFYEATPEFHQSLYVNPYSGAVLKRVDHLQGFFSFALKGHLRLWLPLEIGKQVVGFSVLFFFIIIVTGLLIWMPKKLKNIGKRLRFSWHLKTKWRRKNFDLHTVIGFYMSSFGLLFAFTGCIMAFNWFYYIAYVGTGGNKDPRFITPESVVTTTASSEAISESVASYDLLVPALKKSYPAAQSFELHYPETEKASILVEVNNSKGVYYDRDYLFFDQYSLEELEAHSIYGHYKNTDFADKLIRMNYDIHVGAIGGIVGKIIAFLACLICGSLPVSGIVLWLSRRKRLNAIV